MKTTAAYAALLALLANTSPRTDGTETEERRILELVTKHFAEMQTLTGDLDPDERSHETPEPSAGLRSSSLTTGRLQPAGSLGSAARGLTPAEEWRRLFPRPAGR